MIETLFAIFGKWLMPVTVLFTLVLGLFQRWRTNRLREQLDDAQRANQMHEVKEKVHEQDQVLESGADNEIEKIRDKVNQAGTREQAAEEVANGLNDYFKPSEVINKVYNGTKK